MTFFILKKQISSFFYRRDYLLFFFFVFFINILFQFFNFIEFLSLKKIEPLTIYDFLANYYNTIHFFLFFIISLFSFTKIKNHPYFNVIKKKISFLNIFYSQVFFLFFLSVFYIFLFSIPLFIEKTFNYLMIINFSISLAILSFLYSSMAIYLSSLFSSYLISFLLSFFSFLFFYFIPYINKYNPNYYFYEIINFISPKNYLDIFFLGNYSLSSFFYILAVSLFFFSLYSSKKIYINSIVLLMIFFSFISKNKMVYSLDFIHYSKKEQQMIEFFLKECKSLFLVKNHEQWDVFIKFFNSYKNENFTYKILSPHYHQEEINNLNLKIDEAYCENKTNFEAPDPSTMIYSFLKKTRNKSLKVLAHKSFFKDKNYFLNWLKNENFDIDLVDFFENFEADLILLKNDDLLSYRDLHSLKNYLKNNQKSFLFLYNENLRDQPLIKELFNFLEVKKEIQKNKKDFKINESFLSQNNKKNQLNPTNLKWIMPLWDFIIEDKIYLREENSRLIFMTTEEFLLYDKFYQYFDLNQNIFSWLLKEDLWISALKDEHKAFIYRNELNYTSLFGFLYSLIIYGGTCLFLRRYRPFYS